MKPNTLKTGAFAAFCAVVLVMAAAPDANAQDPRRGYNVGVGAYGTDMWTQSMSGLRLFTPHRNNCDDTTTPTEVFIKIYTDSNSVDFGFCMDLDEHSDGVVEWEDARQACLDDGKRLPEPVEFKFACQAAGTLGLNDMTDDAEWTTNFPLYIISSQHGVAAAASNTNCKSATYGWVARSLTQSDSTVFRCVR